MIAVNESVVEEAALAWFQRLGYTVLSEPQIAPGEPEAERESYDEVVLVGRLRDALARLNPALPAQALIDALNALRRPAYPSQILNNRAVHRMLVDGVPVEYSEDNGEIVGNRAVVIDFDDPLANDWLVVEQYTVHEGDQTRRPDIVVFLNGLPLAVLELKNAADEKATIWNAFQQLQTYKKQISSLFTYNEMLVISDGVEARIGTLTSDRERFQPWRTVGGVAPAPLSMPQLQALIRGVFDPQHFLDLLRYFIVFEDAGAGLLEKKLAGYHQFHAVNKAVASTIAATGSGGSRKCGVVWHTQGAGKSLTMVFYAGRLIVHPALGNPTIVVLTDRIDLDDQLFGVFSRCQELLRQHPEQAGSREELRRLLNVAAGGVIFTTIQKFAPPTDGQDGPLSTRTNIVVVADEAHRSQYNFEANFNKDTGSLTYGFAQHVRDALPNASFIGFTGTPIELADHNTRHVFGDYIDIYDIQQAVEDGATVPIYYENRVAQLDLDEQEKPRLDPEFEEVTESEEVEHKEALKSKWTAFAAIVGTERRLGLIADDLIRHFEQRLEVIDGKAMIVCMSRRICYDLYNQIIARRPGWHSDDDTTGTIKIVMTGTASDPLEWQKHIRTKTRREALALRFRDPTTSFKIVIVRDMWLTGFDAPSLHTMYLDKPMRGHSLMQAIARVNRVFRDKPGGLVVDYLGLADELRLAVADYVISGGKGQTTLDQADAIAVMQAKYEVCRDLFYGFDWSDWIGGSPSERISLLPAAQEHILDQEDGAARLNQAVVELSKSMALAMPSGEALVIRDDVAFFQAVRTALIKTTASNRTIVDDQLDHAVRQLVSRAIAPDQVVDIFAAAGLPKPDISILSDDFLAHIMEMPQHNLAVELLRKLLDDEIRAKSRTNLVQSRRFSEMLERTVRQYQNRAIDSIRVLSELIDLAKDLREADRLGEQTGLSSEELAFYEALEVNDSAVQLLGDERLRAIARDLVESIKHNVTIDWAVRESIRARMRVTVKRILRKYGYPPDKQEKATQTVIEQAELLSETWAV
jgi:type I restriction enzyme R subunit